MSPHFKDVLEITVLAAACLFVVFTFERPRLVLGLWWAVMCVVPYWLELQIGSASFPPQFLLTLLVAPCAVRCMPRIGLRAGDILFLTGLALITLVWLAGGPSQGAWLQLLTQAGAGYFIARTLVPGAGIQFFYRLICISGVFEGCWAIIERFLHVHLFTGLDFGPEKLWAQLLYRGGHVRSETAFGHPIILGAFLAFTVPFIMTWRIGDVRKLAALVIVFVGIYTTGSRGPLLAAIVGLALVLVFGSQRTGGVRVMLGIVSAIVAVPLGLALHQTYSTGAAEQVDSTDYRFSLYHYVLRDVHPLRAANNIAINPITHQQVWRTFGSIDSTFIATALSFGWLPVLLLLSAFVLIALRTLLGLASTAQLAFLAQFPVLATVALITQYRTLVFFFAALAVVTPVPEAETIPGWHRDQEEMFWSRRAATSHTQRRTRSSFKSSGSLPGVEGR